VTEAEAVIELRARLQTGPNPRNPDHSRRLLYAFRPNRSLPAPYQVVSFFVDEPKPPYVYELLDEFMKVLWPGPTAQYRWRSGGVREWDGLVWDSSRRRIDHFVGTDVSLRLYGTLQVLLSGEI